jgi:hypothetical protein
LANKASRSPAVLYEHPLLGEGIAQYLRAVMGIEVSLAPAHDVAAVRRALADDPDVVIFERCASLDELDLHELAPHAEFFDVTTVICHGIANSGSAAVGFDRILQAVGQSVERHGHAHAQRTAE